MVYLLGTTHRSQQSADDVQQVVQVGVCSSSEASIHCLHDLFVRLLLADCQSRIGQPEYGHARTQCIGSASALQQTTFRPSCPHIGIA